MPDLFSEQRFYSEHVIEINPRGEPQASQGRLSGMCGRYMLTSTAEELRGVFAVQEALPFAPRYNAAPMQKMPVVRQDEDGARRLVVLQWGLLPGWAKDPKAVKRPINAMSETVAEKPMFRTAIKKRRCIVPANGFYEWLTEDGKKHPVRFSVNGGKPFGMAGLWEVWERPDQPVIESFTVLTTEPNEVTAKVHNRMPVILPPAAYDLWLNPAEQDAAKVLACVAPYPAEQMRADQVSDRVNSVKNDDAECLALTI